MLLKYFKDLLNDKELMKKTIKLALPMMLQSLIVSSVNLVDNLMVGQLGDNALSGVAVANRYYTLIFFACNAIISASIIYMSQYNGANNETKMKECFRFSLLSSLIMLLLFFGVVRLFSYQLVRFVINDPGIIDMGKRYFSLVCFSYLPLALCVTISSCMRAVGEVKIPMIVSVGSIITNGLLDYALIFGKFGLPELGIEGAAIATVIARILEMCVYLFVLKRGEYRFKTHINEVFVFDLSLAKNILIKAFPLVLNEIFYNLGLTMLMKLYSTRGATVNTAYSVAMTVSDIFFVLFSGMATATTVLIGTPLGANKLEEAKGNGYKLIIFSFLLSFIFAIGMFLSGFAVPILYRNVSIESQILSMKILRCMSVCYWLYMINTECFFVLRSGGDVKSTLFMDSLFMWAVNIPIVAILIYLTDLDIVIIYLIGQYTDAIKLILSSRLIRKERWVKNLTV